MRYYISHYIIAQCPATPQPEEIQKMPADFSYTEYLTVISAVNSKVSDLQNKLYELYTPKLTWSENVPAFAVKGGNRNDIQVQLPVTNENNCQSADSIQVIKKQPDSKGDAESIYADKSIPILRGGEDRELLLDVRISDMAKETGSFSLELPISYQYNDTPQSAITHEETIRMTIVIRNEAFISFENPYEKYQGNPIGADHPEMFYGRGTELKDIVSSLSVNQQGNMNYGRAIAIYGQTRTGKTSFLNQIERKIIDQYDDKIVCCNIGNCAKFLEARLETNQHLANFVYTLPDKLCLGIYENKSVMSALMQHNFNFYDYDSILDHPDAALVLFNRYMDRLDPILEEQHAIIFLLIDEFTYLHDLIHSGKLDCSFMRNRKAMLQEHHVFAILVGQDNMPEFIHEFPNEWGCMEQMKLTCLDESTTKRLISEPLERVTGRKDIFQSSVLDRIYELTAGSAYLTMILCSHPVNYLNQKGASVVTAALLEDFLDHIVFGPNSFLTEELFEPQLQERGHAERNAFNKEILLSVARKSKDCGAAALEDISCSAPPDYLSSLVQRLENRNVLVKDAGKYFIQVKLLELWLLKRYGE